MKRVLIEDISNIAEIMYNNANTGKSVGFVGLYEDVTLLIKELFATYDEINICEIDIESVEIDGYDKEYLITLDDDMDIWCEKAYREKYNGYFTICDDIVLVADDCNSGILKHIETDEVYEVGYDTEDDCDCIGGCEHCCDNTDNCEVITRVATDDDGKLRGFEKSWETHEDGLHYHSTYSFYSSDEKILKDMLDNFKIKY